MTVLKNNWRVYKDIDELSDQLACDILNVAEKSIKSNSDFKIVLAGGTSFINTYRILSKSKSDWSKWHIYLGDERCLQLKDKNRNDYVINRVWLSNGLIPKENINFIPAELGVEKAVLKYKDTLKNVLSFDLVLLSMGEDGHTASLFPGRIYNEKRSVIVEKDSPKYPKNRISMSYSRLNKSKYVFKVVCGNSKQFAFESWVKGVALPINKISGNNEKVFICRDVFCIK